MDQKIKSYFDNLTPGRVIELCKANDPVEFKNAGMDYIDMYGHSIGFINDYQAIVKYREIPKKNIDYFFIC